MPKWPWVLGVRLSKSRRFDPVWLNHSFSHYFFMMHVYYRPVLVDFMHVVGVV